MTKITRKQALLEIEYVVLCDLEDIAIAQLAHGEITEQEFRKVYATRKECKVRVFNASARHCRWPLLTADQVTRAMSGRQP